MTRVKELAKDVYELNLAGLDYDQRTPHINHVADQLGSNLPGNVTYAHKAVVGKVKLMGRDVIIAIAQRTELQSEEPSFAGDVKTYILTPGMQSSSVGMYLYNFNSVYDPATIGRISILRDKGLNGIELDFAADQIIREEFETWWDNMVSLLAKKEK
jgi:hypothetical protein